MEKGTDYEKLGNWKYRVKKGFSIRTEIIPPQKIKTCFSSLTMGGRLYIHKGFCWDGASGAIDTKNIMKASCVHDAFCNWMVQGLLSYDDYWELADKLLRKIALDNGMSAFRATAVYTAVKEWGKVRYGAKFS